MKFIADLHIHSRFSLASAKNINVENLYVAARKKGITVLGTGDFTHPGWLKELKEKLVYDNKGLYQLKDEVTNSCESYIPQSCKGRFRFIPTGEVCNIYKKNGKTRKIHSLLLLPDFNLVEKINLKLKKFGKTESNGRPILNIDIISLFEILLEISDKAMLIPAHIWTPWYSLFGSKSGFNSIEECFEDFSQYIYAAETGLSSDPDMNRNVTFLEKITLISNSDAHSTSKLGREANIFETDLSYDAITSAIKKADSKQFLGTIEYYPEEGKYYADGHRNCNLFLMPKETKKYGGKCPVCNKDITVGVLHRINDLSNKRINRKVPQSYKTIPLIEILSEILKTGPNSKKVKTNYDNLLINLGPELEILNYIDITVLKKAGIPLVYEAIVKMRNNEVSIKPGFDGQYGSIKILKS
ncbi:MAG: endonuclease Q family protein [Proteobacteria bacterium]|nr:endonuclease Q family protein [Pseudomonadota bacterium]